jgi:uncharacterized protein (TIGR02118 family)
MMSAKLIVAYPQPRDVRAFEAVYQNEHVPAANLAGKTKIVSTKILQSPQGTPPFYRIAAVHFHLLKRFSGARSRLAERKRWPMR